jgi:cytochrome c oxidase cbb3-type subunit 2
MLRKADSSATAAVVFALGFFFIGGILTTVVPPMVDKTWARPFHNTDPAKGPTGELKPYTQQELKGRAVYVREGCWYCHTQQTRTLLADTKRSGWKGVDSPISTPDEFVYDNPHMFGTKRTGPDLSRVGGKYDTQWSRTRKSSKPPWPTSKPSDVPRTGVRTTITKSRRAKWTTCTPAYSSPTSCSWS